MVVGVLTCWALLHSMWDLKATKMDMEPSLIWELGLFKFELGHNTAKETKITYCMKGEGVLNHSKQMVKEILLKKQQPWWLGKVS